MDAGENTTNYLSVDIFEPKEAIALLQQSIPAIVKPLVEQGYADYMWRTHSGELRQVERKQWGEVLSDPDRIEDQLRRHLNNQREGKLDLLVEGYIAGDVLGTWTLKPARGNSIWAKERRYSISLARLYAWLYNVGEYVGLVWTPDYGATCQWLVAAFKQDQKPEKSTFQREYKKVEYVSNPQVGKLMGLGLGEATARAMVAEYVTCWRVLNAEPHWLAEVVVGGKKFGMKRSLDFLRGVGRTDV